MDQVIFYTVWIGGSVLAGWIGKRYGRNPITCFVASVVATPVIALPVLFFLGRKQDKPAGEDKREASVHIDGGSGGDGSASTTSRGRDSFWDGGSDGGDGGGD
ncbi:MAG: hypothetical protein AAGI34_07735 [Pseudomonadota bacterium]